MRLKINELEVGAIVTIPLVVKSAVAKETRAKKPYLFLEFFDGTDTISANYWDWATNNIPPVNTILDVSAQVTEWQGVKQLNVKSMASNTTLHIADFAPVSSVDIAEVYKSAYALMSDVKDDTLRTLVLSILEELRERWITVPGAKSVHHAYIGGTLVHSYSVARIASAIAKEIPEASHDLAVVGAMLHDLGKLFTYTVEGVSIDMTQVGKLYEHIFIGAEFIGNFADNTLNTDDPVVEAKISLLRHIILSHHGKLEYGSPVAPQCIEACIVSCADGIDASVEQIREAGNKATGMVWTDKIYTLNNRQHLNPDFIWKVMAGN